VSPRFYVKPDPHGGWNVEDGNRTTFDGRMAHCGSRSDADLIVRLLNAWDRDQEAYKRLYEARKEAAQAAKRDRQ
jgi:hypothetical protein